MHGLYFFATQILQQAWPFVGQYLEKLLVETIAPSIRASSIHLQTLSFTKVNIGEKVYTIKTAAYSVNDSYLIKYNGTRVLMREMQGWYYKHKDSS